MNEWNGWQIPHVGVGEPDREGEESRTDTFIPIRRALDMRMSNFGALNIGNRMAQDVDYTRTVLTYISKDDLADWHTITEDVGPGRLQHRGGDANCSR